MRPSRLWLLIGYGVFLSGFIPWTMSSASLATFGGIVMLCSSFPLVVALVLQEKERERARQVSVAPTD